MLSVSREHSDAARITPGCAGLLEKETEEVHTRHDSCLGGLWVGNAGYFR